MLSSAHDEAVHLLSYEEIELLLDNIERVPASEQPSLLVSLHHAMEARRLYDARESLIGFARYIWPEFRQGPHHKYIARLYDRAVDSEPVYATVSIAPRHGKSQILSWLGPAYFLGKRPTEPVILATHTEDLSTEFGRKIRNTIKSPEYTRIFPETEIAKDSKASGKFNTTAGGGLLCVGVGTSLAGYGGRLIVCGLNTNKVRAERGVIPLSALRQGERIWSRKGWQTVTTTLANRQSTVYTVNRDVDVSPDHPFLLRSGSWVEAHNLRVGDKVKVESIWKRLSRKSNILLNLLKRKPGEA